MFKVFFFSIPVILISILIVGVYTENHCSVYKHGSTKLTVKHKLHLLV